MLMYVWFAFYNQVLHIFFLYNRALRKYLFLSTVVNLINGSDASSSGLFKYLPRAIYSQFSVTYDK